MSLIIAPWLGRHFNYSTVGPPPHPPVGPKSTYQISLSFRITIHLSMKQSIFTTFVTDSAAGKIFDNFPANYADPGL